MLKIKKISFYVALTLIISTTMQFLFVSMRELTDYRNTEQQTAKLDAAYYSHLIVNEINSIDDIEFKSPNFESRSFLLLLLIQKKVGVMSEGERYFFNLAIFVILFGILSSRLLGNAVTSILVQLAVAPIIIYLTLASKESFITIGFTALLVGIINRRGSINIYSVFGVALILFARPILGLLVIISIMGTYLLISGNKKIFYYMVFLLLTMNVVVFDIIYSTGYVYQIMNIGNGIASCNQFGINTCLSGGGWLVDGPIILLRMLMWTFLRFGKGASDLIDGLSGDLDYFEHYINIINVVGTCAVMGGWIMRKKIKYKVNEKIQRSIFIYCVTLLSSLIYITGGIAFYQTQRIYGLVYPLLFFIITTWKGNQKV